MADAAANRITGTSQGVVVPGSVLNVSLNGSGIAIAWLVQAESTEAITHLWFRGGARTGTPPVYSIRIELPDSSGNPDNADAGGGSPTAKTFTPPADTSWNGLGQWIVLTNSWTPTLGQPFYIVIRYSSGTIDASNFFSFSSGYAGFNSASRNIPFFATLSGGTWTKAVTAVVVGWKGATGVYGFPFYNITNASVNTSGHIGAAAVTIPTSICTTFTVIAFEAVIDPGTSGNFIFGIWDASGAAIATTTIDIDALASVAARSMRVVLSSQPTLTAGVEYYYGVRCDGTGTVLIQGLKTTDAADRAAFPLGLSKCMATWDGSAWTKDTTSVPLIEITAADITLPSGGGGGALILGGLGQTGIGAF